MKILRLIPEGDFEANTFEYENNGRPVKEFITKLENGEVISSIEGWDFEFKIIEIPEKEISKEFKNFIRNEIQDYDDSKHTGFYFEDENITV